MHTIFKTKLVCFSFIFRDTNDSGLDLLLLRTRVIVWLTPKFFPSPSRLTKLKAS